MTFKSYAQGGQFGNYHIDLPIKTEINEDLRVAGNFAQQMQRSQKYREKWASSYLAALNDKSSIERQNRDDNFEFAQSNYKRIYEGEQREFEGRLAELRREQAEAAKAAAEPGTLEKIVGFMQAALSVAGTVEGIVNQAQAVQLEQAKEAANVSMEKLAANGVPITGANLKNFNKILTTGSDQEVALRTLREQYPTLQNVTDQDILNVAIGDGRMQLHNQVRAYQQFGGQHVQTKLLTATAPGSGHPTLDPSLPQNLNGANGYSEKVRQYQRELRNEWTGGEVSDEFLLNTIIPNETKLANSIAARNSELWGKQNAVHNTQLELDSINSTMITENPSQSLYNIYQNQAAIFGGDWGKVNQWMVDHVTSKGSLITAEVYETFVNKLVSESPHPPGGPGQQKLRSALTHLQKKGFDSVEHVANLNKVKETQKLLEIDARLKAASPGEQQDIYDEIRNTDWSETSANFQKEIMAKVTPQGQRKYNSPTWSEITGVTDSKLEKSVDTYMLGRVSTGAYFGKHGKTEAIADANYQLARGLIKAEVMRVWGETEKNFPTHVGNTDIILQKAISQSVENLLDGPAPKLSLDNVDLKEPTKPIRFNVSKAFQGRTTADFYNDIEPFKETKTIPKGQFPELTGRDGAMIDRFALIRSRTKGGPVAIEHVMARANSQWATELSEALGITKFEALDQGLRSRGHEGLDKANMVTSAQAGIHDRLVADYVDGAKTINETSLRIRAEALNGALGSTPAPYTQTNWGGVNILGPDELGLGGGPSHSGPRDAHLDGGVRDKNKGNYIVTGLQKLGYQVTEHPLAGGVTPNVHAPGDFSHDNGYKWDIPYSQFGAVGTPIGEIDRQWTVKLEAAHRALVHGYENGISIDDIVRQHTNIAGPSFELQQLEPVVQPITENIPAMTPVDLDNNQEEDPIANAIGTVFNALGGNKE